MDQREMQDTDITRAATRVAIVNPETLQPMTTVSGPALALVAAWVGETRLIDNQLRPVPTSSRPPAAGSNTRSD